MNPYAKPPPLVEPTDDEIRGIDGPLYTVNIPAVSLVVAAVDIDSLAAWFDRQGCDLGVYFREALAAM